MTRDRDSQGVFQLGYSTGYERACADWEEKIDEIKETIERKISDYDDRDASEYEDCLAIIDAVLGKED